MQPIRKLLQLDKIKYYETHLSLINCVLPAKMTPTEIKVIAQFMSLEGDIAQYRFGPSGKKIVRKELDLSPAGLSNYMSSLTEKGFLTKTGDIISIHPILVPEKIEQQYSFRLINLG